MSDAWPMPLSGFPFLGYCKIVVDVGQILCGAKVFDSPSGPWCIDGHGGSPFPTTLRHNATMSEEPKKIRRRAITKAEDVVAAISAEAGKVFEQIADTSQKLNAELTKSDEEKRKIPIPPPYTPPTLKRGFDVIIVNMFESEFEPEVEFRELQSKLSLGVDRSDRQHVLESIDEAETMCRRAHKLYIVASDESARYTIQCDLVLSPIWESARAMLQADKEAGKLAKQITDADVRARAAIYYPDEFSHQELKKARVVAMVKDFAHLVDMWQSRCASLRAMLDKSR